jgi:hypothetical protein
MKSTAAFPITPLYPMNSTKPGPQRRPHALLLAVLALAGVLLPRVSAAAAAELQVVDLIYRESPTSIVNLGLNTTTASAPFAKEPAVSAQVLRGKFRFGSTETNALAFLWDRRSGKLFLDLNRNLDLTDDAGGVLVPQRGNSGNYASFTNVHLTLRTPAAEQPLAGDLTLWGYGSQPNGWFALRSFWHGKARLQGADWEVGLIAGDFSRPDPTQANWLLLRPWSKQDQPFAAQDGSLQAVRFARKLFLNGQGYTLTLTNTTTGRTGVPQLRLQPEQPTLGEAKLAGKFIERLMLDGDYLVVLDRPASSVRLPLGSYAEPQVCLQAGGASAHLDSNHLPS